MVITAEASEKNQIGLMRLKGTDRCLYELTLSLYMSGKLNLLSVGAKAEASSGSSLSPGSGYSIVGFRVASARLAFTGF